MARPVRYLADEHIAAAVVAGLRSRGIDVSGVREAGLLEASDEDLLAWARAHGRVVSTHDADDMVGHVEFI
jgi:predicted nuclease of predicted toxin-antitoxin system